MLLRRRLRRWTSSYVDVPSTVQPPAGLVLDDYPSYSLFLVSSAHYILLFIAWCAYGGRGGLSIAPDGVSMFYDFFKVFYLLSTSRRLNRLSNNLAARDYVRVVMFTDFVITLAICIICQFAAPPPLVTSQGSLTVETSVNANLV